MVVKRRWSLERGQSSRTSNPRLRVRDRVRVRVRVGEGVSHREWRSVNDARHIKVPHRVVLCEAITLPECVSAPCESVLRNIPGWYFHAL